MKGAFLLLFCSIEIASTSSVNCGKSRAANCGQCGNSEEMCNVDCQWKEGSSSGDGSCERVVSCGGHSAQGCELCGDESYCNGDCLWNDGVCEIDLKDHKSCKAGSDLREEKCFFCGKTLNEDEWDGEKCGSDVCVFNSISSTCNDVYSDDVRTASVWLNYDTPSQLEEPAWWFNKVVPIHSTWYTYFATSVQGYGYGGIQQQNDTMGNAIFSIWDQNGCDTDIAKDCDPINFAKGMLCGEGVVCPDFGAEGTGKKSQLFIPDFPKIGTEYHFATNAVSLGGNEVEYTGYFYDGGYENGMWRLMARFRVAEKTDRDWWLLDMGSFVEDFGPFNTTTNARAALFGPTFLADANGTKASLVQVQKAKYTYGGNPPENHEHVNAWQEDEAFDHAIGIATGGDTEPLVFDNHSFNYDQGAEFDKTYEDLRSRIGCLNGADTRADIECCLGKNDSCGLEPGRDDQKTPSATTTDGETIEEASTAETPNKAITVDCGNHEAQTCEACPFDGDTNQGYTWCNGDCEWSSGQCVLVSREITAQQETINESSAAETPNKAITVDCGNHEAQTCEACPFDGDTNQGFTWCNGDCEWSSGQCVLVSSQTTAQQETIKESSAAETPNKAITVDCGNHSAPTCEACPFDGDTNQGFTWCNGDCEWSSGQCVLVSSQTNSLNAETTDKAITVDCGNHSAPTCEACPFDGDTNQGSTWCNGDCEWNSGTDRCVFG